MSITFCKAKSEMANKKRQMVVCKKVNIDEIKSGAKGKIGHPK